MVENWTVITKDFNTLPLQGIEVLGFNKEWIDEDFNPDGIRLCYLQDFADDEEDKIWLMSAWCNTHDEWHTLSTDDKIEEGQIPRPAPTHWMDKPKSPKE